ncbi:MAG: transcriptional repressor LexA [Chloroflexota bacterium]|nr:MAG: transcriptional repressor LexA [Chloroflexota bacterium]
MSRLSPRQERMLDFIGSFRGQRGYPPTVREIGRAAGISSTSVVDYNLNILEKAGIIRRDREVSRGIEVLGDEGRPTTGVSVPIIGQIAAGAPIEATIGHHDTIELSASLVPAGAYALRVKGLSMIEDLIDDGDLVIIEPRETATNGDIVVALITDGDQPEGAATLKRFYREANRIRLQPRNPDMAPIYVRPDHLRIQGKVVSLVRQMA